MERVKTLTVSPLNRVEGDLELKVDIRDGRVTRAFSSGVMFRGLERLLLRRDPLDALVFTCRVCGVCSISHSSAASLALRSAFGTAMPPNACFMRNAALAAESLLSHLGGFYTSFLVDFTNKHYAQRAWYAQAAAQFTCLNGSSYVRAVKARKNFLAFLGLFVGKWPNTLALQPGGVTKAMTFSELGRARGVLIELRDFVEQQLLGCRLERFLELESGDDLRKWLEKDAHHNSDFGLYLRAADDIGLESLGKGPKRLLCCSAYESPDGSALYKSGYLDRAPKPFQLPKIAEDTGHSFFAGKGGPEHSLMETTEPDADKKGAYSWVKAPRYGGKVVEVGPFARLVINRNPLIIDFLENSGSNVHTRVLARVYEIPLLLRSVEDWISRIDPEEPFHMPHGKAGNPQGAYSGTGSISKTPGSNRIRL